MQRTGEVEIIALINTLLSIKDKINGHCYGGVARMSSYIKSVRDTDPEALVLNAGDFYQGRTLFDA